jgi:hypothetical protein
MMSKTVEHDLKAFSAIKKHLTDICAKCKLDTKLGEGAGGVPNCGSCKLPLIRTDADLPIYGRTQPMKNVKPEDTQCCTAGSLVYEIRKQFLAHCKSCKAQHDFENGPICCAECDISSFRPTVGLGADGRLD